MPVLLTGYELIDRSFLPLLARGLSACARNNEDELAEILTRFKKELNNYTSSHSPTNSPIPVKYESKGLLRAAIAELTGSTGIGLDTLTDHHWRLGITASKYREMREGYIKEQNAKYKAEMEAHEQAAWEDQIAKEQASNAAERTVTKTVEPVNKHIFRTPGIEPLDEELTLECESLADQFPDWSQEDILIQAAKNLKLKSPSSD